jgi:lysophospholipase L1-like esterase
MDRRYLPFLGYLGKPNNAPPTLRTKELGFRDRAVLPRQPDEFRILVLGGSTAWGVGASSNEHTVSAALEKVLNKGGGKPKYRVMSGAFLGYIARQEMIVLTEFLRDFDPDLVVSLTGYNDLITVIHQVGGNLDRPESKKLGEAVEANLRPMETLPAIRKVVGSLGMWRLVVYFRELRAAANPTGGEYRYDGARLAQWMPRIADIHRMMARLANDNGRRYVIALQPDLETTRKPMVPEEAALRSAATAKSRSFPETWDAYRRDLASALGQLDGVLVIDLAGAFDGIASPGFVDGCHLTDQGYERLAKALAVALAPSLPRPQMWQ